MKKVLCFTMSLILTVFLAAFAFAQTPQFCAGDVNGDARVEPEDARLALRASVRLLRLAGSAFTAADVNGDGEIGSDDARRILRAAVKLETLPELLKPTEPSTESEFNYLRDGTFYLQGTMTDSTGQSLPLEMAVTPNSVYMLSTFEGAAMGMLINNGTTYMIYPAEKSYLELNDETMKAMGMNPSDLISNTDLSFSKYGLAKADATATETVDGRECKVYIFNSDSGSTRFFMDGDKLVRFANYDVNGKPDVVNDVSYITDQVPADKINPPADYKEYKGLTGMFSFIALLGDVVGE